MSKAIYKGTSKNHIRDVGGREIFISWRAMTDLHPALKGRVQDFFGFPAVPKSQKELASAIGVTEGAISNWARDPQIMRKIAKQKRRLQGDYLMKNLRTADDKLLEKVRSGDLKALQIYYDQIAKREQWDVMDEEEKASAKARGYTKELGRLKQSVGELSELITGDMYAEFQHEFGLQPNEHEAAFVVVGENPGSPDSELEEERTSGDHRLLAEGEEKGAMEERPADLG